MFKPLDGMAPAPLVALQVDGCTVLAPKGRTLALALMEAGCRATRHDHQGVPRAPYCLMGVCFECVVQLNGQDHVQACLVRVEPGMQVRLPQGGCEVGNA